MGLLSRVSMYRICGCGVCRGRCVDGCVVVCMGCAGVCGGVYGWVCFSLALLFCFCSVLVVFLFLNLEKSQLFIDLSDIKYPSGKLLHTLVYTPCT